MPLPGGSPGPKPGRSSRRKTGIWTGHESVLLTRCTLFVCGLWLLGVLAVWGQANRSAPDPADFLARRWQVEEGLPQNSVNCFAQTPDGYLWMGTFNGLVRFDGLRFTVYDAGNTPSLVSSRIVRLFCDREGQLWILDEFGGVSLRRGSQFISPGPEGLGTERAVAVGEDALGRVWIGTASGALFRWDGTRFLQILAPNSPVNPIPGIFQIEPHPQDGVWIVCDPSRAYHVQGAQAVPLLDPDGRSDEIRRLAPARGGGFWVLTVHSGLLRWQDGRWSTTRWRVPPIDSYVWSMKEDRKGNLWYAQYRVGLQRLTATGPVEPVGSGRDPWFATTRALFEDAEGTLWAGTDGDGLVQMRQRDIHLLGREDGLRQEMVMAVTEDVGGGIWLGYNNFGIDRLDPSGKTEMLTQEPELLPITPVWAMLRDRSGGIWISEYNAGLVHYTQGRFVSVPTSIGPRILALFEDRKGDIWVGARQERGQAPVGVVSGLARIHDGIATSYVWAGAQHDGVRAIAEDASGAIWLGTDGAGLFKHTGTNTVAFVPSGGLPSQRVSALLGDPDSNLWIGTFHEGLLLLREDRLFAFRSDRGLPFNSVSSLAVDATDHLWMTTEQGVIRMPRNDLIDYAEGRSHHISRVQLNKLSGLPTLSEVGGVFFATDGRAWIPTGKGVGWVSPAQLLENTNPPPVQIEAITVNGRRHPLGAPGEPAGADALRWIDGRAVIPPGNRTLEFDYTALSFSEPEANSFRYRLEGLDEGWTWAKDRRTAFFTSVPPGHYRFHVLAANNHGVWNETGAVVPVTVEPFFWQTGLFRGALLLGLVGLGAWVEARLTAARHRREFARIEEQNMRSRAETLAATNKELESKTRELESALANVKTLRGFIPICASCKKIRDDRGFWNRVETYIQKHSEATFSHGICPECAQKLYPDYHATPEDGTVDPGSPPGLDKTGKG